METFDTCRPHIVVNLAAQAIVRRHGGRTDMSAVLYAVTKKTDELMRFAIQFVIYRIAIL